MDLGFELQMLSQEDLKYGSRRLERNKARSVNAIQDQQSWVATYLGLLDAMYSCLERMPYFFDYYSNVMVVFRAILGCRYILWDTPAFRV